MSNDYNLEMMKAKCRAILCDTNIYQMLNNATLESFFVFYSKTRCFFVSGMDPRVRLKHSFLCMKFGVICLYFAIQLVGEGGNISMIIVQEVTLDIQRVD